VRNEALIGARRNVGDRRRAVFADGSSALEEITTYQIQQFQYEVWNLKTDTGRYITHAFSDFRFSGRGRVTHVRWAYSLHRRGLPDDLFNSEFGHHDFRQFMEATLTAVQVPARAEPGGLRCAPALAARATSDVEDAGTTCNAGCDSVFLCRP
jgi:hypothetical protein